MPVSAGSSQGAASDLHEVLFGDPLLLECFIQTLRFLKIHLNGKL
jgi:hypothetical protein